MAELMITAINIFLLSFVAGYIGYPMISKALNKRKTQIAEQIHTASQDRADALLLAQDYETRLKNFEQEREVILAQAREKAKAGEEEMMREAQSEAARIVNRADREAALLQAKVRDEIRRDMITYATAAAAKLIAENMTTPQQDALIEETLKEMGEQTWQN